MSLLLECGCLCARVSVCGVWRVCVGVGVGVSVSVSVSGPPWLAMENHLMHKMVT